MNLNQKIFNSLYQECILEGEAQILEFVMNRKKQILENHYKNVCRLYRPGEGGQKRYYHTKLTPKNRRNQNKVYGKTLEELEEKIVAYYLKIEADTKTTVRDILVKSVDESSKTGKRALQRFDKRFPLLKDLKISSLDETHIKTSLDALIASNISAKEFNESISCLNKIVAYCTYEHIDIIDIKTIINAFRKTKLRGKHIFKDTTKQTRNLAFSRAETSRIVRDAIKHPSYKSLAIATLILTGLRVGELLAIEMDDIYLDDGYIWVHHIEDTKTFELLDYVKENKSREVYLSDDALNIIRFAIDYRMNDSSDSPFLFLNANAADGKMHLRALDNHVRKYIHTTVLGLGADREPRSPHDCRRTYASLEFLNGTDIYTLKNQLGHSKITQTEEYIKDILDASERRNRLKGTGIIYDLEFRRDLDAKCAK